MWSLELPAFLALLLAVPALIYLAHFRRARGGKLSVNVGVWKAESFRFPGSARRIVLLAARCLFWTGFSLLVVALAGPVQVEKRRTYLSRGLDMIIALDESPSMSARDSGPASRFEAARQVIKEFVAGRENDAIGLVSFARQAALRVPPTLDYAYFAAAVDSLRIMELGDGTAIGTGLAVAALHLRGSRAKEKLIILVTDGDNNAGEISPEKAASVAAALGVRIYAIGIGTEGEAALELTDPETGKQYRGIYRGRLNEALLRRIASLTGGKYFRSGSLGILSEIFQEIGQIERTQAEVTVSVQRRPRHEPFILAALGCIMFALLAAKLLLGELL